MNYALTEIKRIIEEEKIRKGSESFVEGEI